MRFLIGIMIGAILTLLFATAMDAPTHPILDRTQVAVAGIWDRLISTTSESLFTESSQVAAPTGFLEDLQKDRRTEPQKDRLDEILHASNTPEDQPAGYAATPPSARAPATGLAAPQAVAAPPPAVVARSPVAAGQFADTMPDPIIGNLAVNAADRPEEPVWVPFHSLMSAEGFAARLARELDHDFQVERRSAGNYQVVFQSSDPAERAELMAQISEITGQ